MRADAGATEDRTMTEAAWKEHRERLLHFVGQRVEDEATAEDIVQDVLLRAYRSADTLREGAKLESWLYRITRNAVVDHYRARRATEPLPPDFPSDESAPGEASARADLARCLRPFIEELPETYRAALELSELDGLTQQDTAERLGLGLSGAKSRVQRGRRMLRDRYLECCRIEFDSRGSIMAYDPIRRD